MEGTFFVYLASTYFENESELQQDFQSTTLSHSRSIQQPGSKLIYSAYSRMHPSHYLTSLDVQWTAEPAEPYVLL